MVVGLTGSYGMCLLSFLLPNSTHPRLPMMLV